MNIQDKGKIFRITPFCEVNKKIFYLNCTFTDLDLVLFVHYSQLFNLLLYDGVS